MSAQISKEVQALARQEWFPIFMRELGYEAVVRCEECKFFELNHFDNLDGVPIITAHEICTKWGNGCKTDRNGYCFMAERREDDERIYLRD